MANIAFLLLAHRDPGRLATKVRALVSHGDKVAIHFDANARKTDWQQLRQELDGVDGVTFARRHRCGWGEWSLVRATLSLVEAAQQAFGDATHFLLMSGDCYPTKSRGYLDDYLSQERDVIECADFYGGWIRTGLQDERLIYRHWFNERAHPKLFYGALEMQKKLGWAREVPEGLEMRIGSQWWALRRDTVDRVMAFLRKRRDVIRFFRTTWIPDETFFQTLVANLVPEEEIAGHPPTHLRFSDYGMPVVYHDDHADYLRTSNQPFARKISPHASDLQEGLLARFRAWDDEAEEGGLSSNLYAYLTHRGRSGVRYAPRFWEQATRQRPDARLRLIAAKLWHVGETIERQAAHVTGRQALGYLFDNDNDPDIALGGLQHGVGKRNRHRLALMGLVFETLGAEEVLMCIDPARIDSIAEMVDSFGDVRILLAERPVPRDHLIDHARRTGLLGASSGEFEEREVITALTQEFGAETETLRHRFGDRVFLNDPAQAHERNVEDMRRFLDLSTEKAESIARHARLQT